MDLCHIEHSLEISNQLLFASIGNILAANHATLNLCTQKGFNAHNEKQRSNFKLCIKTLFGLQIFKVAWIAARILPIDTNESIAPPRSLDSIVQLQWLALWMGSAKEEENHPAALTARPRITA